MKSTRVLEQPRHVSVDIVVRDGMQRHTDCGRNRVLWHQDSRDDHALPFSASVAMFGVENEVDNIPVDFRFGEAGGEGIWNWTRFYQRHGWQLLVAGHDRVPQNRRGGVSRNLCDNYKPASLHFSITNRSKDKLSSNSIRSRTAPPHRSATIAGGVIPRASGTSYDASSRRNLAGNAIVVARSLTQRAYSLRSNQVENSTTDTAKALPGIVDGSVYRFGPHVGHINMRGLSGAQKSFAKGASHV